MVRPKSLRKPLTSTSAIRKRQSRLILFSNFNFRRPKSGLKRVLVQIGTNWKGRQCYAVYSVGLKKVGCKLVADPLRGTRGPRGLLTNCPRLGLRRNRPE